MRLFTHLHHVSGALQMLYLLFGRQPSSAFVSYPQPMRTPPSPLSSSTTFDTEFTTFTVDYHAANEFIDAHYPQLFTGNSHQTYFHAEGVRLEHVWNARHGVLDEETNNNKHPASLDRNGFALFRQPTQVTDFTELKQIQQIYLGELLELLRGASISTNSHHILFWNPVLRGTNLESQDRLLLPACDASREELIIGQVAQSTTADMVHIDTDIGAHPQPCGFLNAMYKNRVVPTGGECTLPTFDEMQTAINAGNRFSIFNFWRNADSNNPVIQRAPLGVYLPYYCNGNKTRFDCFPASCPHPTLSKWYYYPEMTFDEVLVFRQYDRDAHYVSDLWHSALKNPGADNSNSTTQSRLSFDIRALMVARDEIVPTDRDRYASDRMQPQLDFEMSRDEFTKKQDASQIKREQEQSMP